MLSEKRGPGSGRDGAVIRIPSPAVGRGRESRAGSKTHLCESRQKTHQEMPAGYSGSGSREQMRTRAEGWRGRGRLVGGDVAVFEEFWKRAGWDNGKWPTLGHFSPQRGKDGTAGYPAHHDPCHVHRIIPRCTGQRVTASTSGEPNSCPDSRQQETVTGPYTCMIESLECCRM